MGTVQLGTDNSLVSGNNRSAWPPTVEDPSREFLADRRKPNAKPEIRPSGRHRILGQNSCTITCPRLAAHRLQARSTSCSQLLAADRASLRHVPLRSARTDRFWKKIQVGRVCVYNKARGDRREKRSQCSAAPARSFSSFRSIRHVIHGHEIASTCDAERQLSVSTRCFPVPRG